MAEEILDDNIPQQEPTRKIPTPDEVLGKQPTTATRRVPTPDDVFGTVKKNTNSPSTNNSQSLDGSSQSKGEFKTGEFQFDKNANNVYQIQDGKKVYLQSNGENSQLGENKEANSLQQGFDFNKTFGTQKVNVPISESTKTKYSVPTGSDIAEKYKASQEFKSTAIKNSAKKLLDNSKIPYTEGDDNFNKALELTKQDLKEGVGDYAYDKNGNPTVLTKGNLGSGLQESLQKEKEDQSLISDLSNVGTNYKLGSSLLENKIFNDENKEKKYTNTTSHQIGNLLGSWLKPILLNTVGNVIAPAAGSGLVGAESERVNVDKLVELYNRNKEELKGKVPDDKLNETAYMKAKQDAASASIPKALMDAYFFKETPEAAQSLQAAKQATKNVVGNIAKITGLGASESLGTSAIEKAQGYNVTPQEAISKAIDNGTNYGIMDAMFHIIPLAKTAFGKEYIPKDFVSKAKEAIVNNISDEGIDKITSSIPDGEQVKKDIEDYKKAREKVVGKVSQEEIPNYAGWINGIEGNNEKIKELKSKLTGNETFDADTNKQISDLEKDNELKHNKITEAKKAQGKISADEFETKQIQQPTKVEKPIKEEINQPIGEAKETKREGKESIVPEHNNIETNPNYRTAYAGNHEGEQEFTHFILNGKKYPIDGNEELLKNNPDAKLDKSKESQTETKKQQTENIKKFNVPLDEGTRNPKGETMQDFVGRVVSQYEKDKSQQLDNSVIVAHSSVLKALKTYEALKDKPLFKNADWDNLTDEQAKAFTDHYTKESTNNGDIEIYDNGKGGKIKIARHGQTEDNLTGKFRNDETNLTAKGIQQAKELGAKLGEKPPKIISSDLPRAIHTANLAMGEIVTPTEKVLPKEETIEQSLKETPETKSITPTVSELKEVSKQQKVNDLIDKYNNKKLSPLEENEARKAAKELGLEYDKSKQKIVNADGRVIKKREEIQNKTVVEDFDRNDYDKNVNKHIDTIIENPLAFKGLEILGTDGKRLSEAQQKNAIESIKNGNVNYAGKALFDFIDNANKKGGVEIEDVTTGKRELVPVDDYFNAFKEPIKPLTDNEIELLNTQLGEDVFDKLINNEINEIYEQENAEQNQPINEGTKTEVKPTVSSSEKTTGTTETKSITPNTENNAIQIGSAEKNVSRSGTTGENKPESSEGVRPSKQGNELATETKSNNEGIPPTGTEKKNALGEEENDVTSIKNELTRSRREQFGLKEEEETIKKDFGTTWDEAKSKIDDGFHTQDLIDELKKKPRAINDVEDALLLHHQNEKEIQLLKTNEQINKAAESGDESLLAEAKVRRARLLDELQDVYDVNKAAGRETARGLSARRMMVDRKYNLVNMMAEARATNDGKPLTEEQSNEIEKLHQKIKEKDAAYDEYVKGAEKEIKDLQEKILSKKVVDKKSAANKLRDWADKLEKNTKGQTFATIIPVTPKMVANAMRLIAYGLDKGEDVLDLIKKAVDEIKKLHPNVDEEKLNKEINKEVINAGIIAPTKENKILRDIYEITLNRKAIHLKAEAQRAKDEFDIKLKKEEAKNRSTSQKIQDTFIQWQRAFKLSNPVTMGKLFMAAVTRATTTPAEDIIGGGFNKILPKSLTSGAIGEGGGLHIKETADAYKKGITDGMKDSYEIMRRGGHGKSDLDVLFSKTAHLPPEAIDFFGQLHSATKAPIKRAIFERSLSKRLRRSIAVGMDVSNPMVQTEIALGAYKDANRAIFMQDNKVATGWQKMVDYLGKADPKTGKNNTKLAATVLQWLVPFVKVPTNIAAEIGTNIYGVPVGVAKIVHGLFTGGLEKLSADEKDVIMRNLKKGTLGAAALTLGYMNPQIFGGYYQDKEKRKPSDAKAGGIKLFGMNIPAWFIESPIFQAAQVGATIRRVKDTMVKGEEKGISEGVWAGALGMADKVPMVDQVNRTLGAIKDPKERQYYLDQLAKSTLEPALLQKIAEWTDPEDKRKPQDLEEHLESGIPVLRENVRSAVGIKDVNSKEYKFLKDKNEGIVPYKRESLKPVNEYGKDVPVTDEDYNKFLDRREAIIKQEVGKLLSGEAQVRGKNGNMIRLSKEDAQKLSPEQLRSYLMRITTEADKLAIYRVFNGVEKPKSTKEGEVYTH